jgi:Hemerythrin HHE cation binding domain
MNPMPSASSRTLLEEHAEFAAGTEHVRRVADAVGHAPMDELRPDLCRAYEELLRQVVPHAMAEDRSPLSQVDRNDSRSRSLLDPVTREHLEIEQLLVELDGLRWELAHPVITSAQEQALRRVLYGLYALLHVHLVSGTGCICEPPIVVR